MNRYRKLRIVLASLFVVAITVLFLDFTGVTHAYLGWMAHVQLLPAILALNVAVVALLLVLTLLFGRLYCSVICPLGVMQDLFARLGRKAKRNRYGYSKPKQWLRVSVLVLFVVLMVAGFASVAALVAPYSAFGRIATTMLQPIWVGANNLLAMLAERWGSYAFYRVELLWQAGLSLAVAVVTLVVVGWLAWRNGRTWCNTICPVGTLLGFVARFSWLRPVINIEKCNGCRRCERNCKAACIDPKHHTIDMSRCVVCFDCLDYCRQGAISYQPRRPKAAADVADSTEKGGLSRRSFLSLTALFAATTAVQAKRKKVDGGLAILADKEAPQRKQPIVPAGARSWRHLSRNCTACQLCISACPNQVLCPSSGLMTLMQPTISYERGYCRPECTRCAEVCPTNAIEPITREEKSSTSIGHAVWIAQNCVAASGQAKCNNCAHHCPSGAITMVEAEGYPYPIPAVDTERCIGCGACEYLCPSRPFAAIYVEGNDMHRTI